MTSINRIPLSKLSADPVLVAFFQRGERDAGAAFAVPATPKPVLTGGAAVQAYA